MSSEPIGKLSTDLGPEYGEYLGETLSIDAERWKSKLCISAKQPQMKTMQVSDSDLETTAQTRKLSPSL